MLAAVALIVAGCGQRAGIHLEVPDPSAAELASGTTAGERAPGKRRASGASAPELGIPPVPEGASSITWEQWAALFLPRIAAPVCRENVIAVVAWAAQENTDAGWNPLATTLRMSGSTRFNGAGVRNYASLEQGLQATVLTLQQGMEVHGYGPIVDGLRRCAHPMETARAVNASRWCLGCSGGAYVTRMVPAVAAAYGWGRS